jgi:hypothetical protein
MWLDRSPVGKQPLPSQGLHANPVPDPGVKGLKAADGTSKTWKDATDCHGVEQRRLQLSPSATFMSKRRGVWSFSLWANKRALYNDSFLFHTALHVPSCVSLVFVMSLWYMVVSHHSLLALSCIISAFSCWPVCFQCCDPLKLRSKETAFFVPKVSVFGGCSFWETTSFRIDPASALKAATWEEIEGIAARKNTNAKTHHQTKIHKTYQNINKTILQDTVAHNHKEKGKSLRSHIGNTLDTFMIHVWKFDGLYARWLQSAFHKTSILLKSQHEASAGWQRW